MITPRGRRVVTTIAAGTLGVILGFTADHWNPWANPASAPANEHRLEEDGSRADGYCLPFALCDDRND